MALAAPTSAWQPPSAPAKVARLATTWPKPAATYKARQTASSSAEPVRQSGSSTAGRKNGKTALCELENAGLLTRVRQGLTKANRLFLQIPDGVQLSSPLMGKGCLSEVQKTAPLDGQKLPTSNTDTEYKEHSKTKRVESTRRRYGEFQNVFLSGEECTRLETAYPGKAAEYIERLSRYMASNDRHYANHYATIKKWLDEDSKGRSAKNYTYDDNEGECL